MNRVLIANTIKMMNTIYIEKKKPFVLRATEVGLLFVIGLYVLTKDITKTTLKLGLASGKDKYIIIMLGVLVAIRLAILLLEDKENRNLWMRFIIIALVVDAAFFCMWHAYPANTLVILALLNLGLIGIEYNKVLKSYIIAASMAIFPAIVMAWIGAIDNYVYIRDMIIRSSWGIKYPTDMMSLLFFLLLAAWVVYGRKGGFWFVIPGVVLTLMAYSVADSRTGAFCGMLFIVSVCVEHWLSHTKQNMLSKALEIFACGSFPFFTVLMNGLVLAYKQGSPIAIKANRILSDRLALSLEAFNKYGIGFWGKPLEMVGNGGSSFARPEYFFVDISYVLLLIRFGVIALLIINVLWVLMTRKAFKNKDIRLALALALISVNFAIEHHVLQLNYDIFIVIAFAVLTAQGVEEKECLREKEPIEVQGHCFKSVAEQFCIISVLTAVSTVSVLALLPEARTIISLTSIASNKGGRRVLVLLVIAGIFLTAKTLQCVYKLVLGAITKTRHNNKAYITLITAFALVMCMTIAVSNLLINTGTTKKANLLEKERKIIELVQANNSGKLYAVGMPAIYNKQFGGISSSLFDGEELARYSNISVITKKDLDSPCFFKTGFLYTPISYEHALYTNNVKVIKALQDGGYHLTGFYPIEMVVDLGDLANKNNIVLSEDEAITLHGEEESLNKGPGVDLRAGRYTISYDLKLDSASSINDDGEVCRLVTTYYKKKYELNDTVITKREFDENGEYTADIIIDFPDAENTYFCIYPIGSNTVTINSIRYRKTPEYDVHIIYNEKRLKKKEEYYDLDGEPYTGTWGYFARELECDRKGNIIKEMYFDNEGNKIRNAYGYHEIKRTFNEHNQDVRDEFYDIDGKRVNLDAGQSAVVYEYDEYGRQKVVLFYDASNKPVIVDGGSWGGYHKVVRNYDDYGRIILETFYDVEGEPVITREGYSSRETIYEGSSGKIINYKYYDTLGNEIEV